MAIQLVGRQKGSFAGTTIGQNINFALTGGLSSAPAEGDLILVSYAVATNNRTPAMLIRDGVSSTEYTDVLGSTLHADGSYDTRLRAAYRFKGSAGENVQFYGGTGSSYDAGAYDIIVLRGVDTGTPFDVSAATATGTDGHAADPPSITPVTEGAWTFHAGASACATGAEHTSGDLSDFLSSTQADTYNVNLGAGLLSKGWTSGAQNPAAFGGGGSGATGDSWAAFSVAFRPAAVTSVPSRRALLGVGY